MAEDSVTFKGTALGDVLVKFAPPVMERTTKAVKPMVDASAPYLPDSSANVVFRQTVVVAVAAVANWYTLHSTISAYSSLIGTKGSLVAKDSTGAARATYSAARLDDIQPSTPADLAQSNYDFGLTFIFTCNAKAT